MRLFEINSPWECGHHSLMLAPRQRWRPVSPAASQILWCGPRLICIAGDFTRYDVHAVREHRRSIDLVRHRLFGRDLLGLEAVASVSGGMPYSSVVRRGGRLTVILPGQAPFFCV